jgi:hypothetical protein
VDSIKAVRYETFQPADFHFLPMVYTAPTTFQMESFKGKMTSWNEFGRWINEINESKKDLKGIDFQEIDEIVKSANSYEDRIRLLYDYIQRKTRYVSIQLGIGGWSPFSPSYVHQKKYGDCKALTFYTKTLLEHVGVDAYYTLIKAGKYADEVPDFFPNAHFNHVILTIPLENDTVWLECTSQTNPFGYLGTFTSNRNALLITEEGGKLIRTRSYDTQNSEESINAYIQLNKDGAAKVSLNKTYSGLAFEEDNFGYALHLPEEEQLHWLLDVNEWGDFVINDFSLFESSVDQNPSGKLSVNLEISDLGTRTRNYILVKPSLMQHISEINVKSAKRTLPIHVKYPISQVDSLIYNFSENLPLITEISNVAIDNKFGSYQLSVEKNVDQVIVTRKLKLYKGYYAVEDYPDFRNFINTVQKNDQLELIFRNGT